MVKRTRPAPPVTSAFDPKETFSFRFAHLGLNTSPLTLLDQTQLTVVNRLTETSLRGTDNGIRQ